MMDSAVSEELRRFVLTSVPSVPFVEALLIFRESTEPKGIGLVARRLYVGPQAAAQAIEQLSAAGVITLAGDGEGYLYSPPPQLAPLLDELASAYRLHLVEITALIHSRTGRMAQHFADAFKLRKE